MDYTCFPVYFEGHIHNLLSQRVHHSFPRASWDEHMTLALLKQCRHTHPEQQCLCMLTVLDFKKNLAVFYICVPAESQGFTEILRAFEVSCRLPEVRYTVLYVFLRISGVSVCNLHVFLHVFRLSEATQSTPEPQQKPNRGPERSTESPRVPPVAPQSAPDSP